MKYFVCALVLVTMTQPTFAGGGNKDKIKKAGIGSRIMQLLTPDVAPPRQQNEYTSRRDERPQHSLPLIEQHHPLQ